MDILDDILKMKEKVINENENENENKHQKNLREKRIIMEKVDVKCCSPRIFRKNIKKNKNKNNKKCSLNNSALTREKKDKRDLEMICSSEVCVLCVLGCIF